jgi:hypothetical protein
VIGLTALVQLNFMRRSGYPARFFGVTLKNAGRHAREALALTVPLLALVVALKMLAVRLVPGMRGDPVFEWMAGTPVTPVLIVAYSVLIPFQELVTRGGLQGALEHFLVGRGRTWKAILGSNVIFSAGHLYISSGLSVAAFLPGLFWGWLYSRQRTLVGVSLSHLVLGYWAFYVVGIRLD